MPAMLKSVRLLTVLYSRSCIIGDLAVDQGLISLDTSSRLNFILNIARASCQAFLQTLR